MRRKDGHAKEISQPGDMQRILSTPVTIAAGIQPKVRIRAHPPPTAPPFAHPRKTGSFGAGSTLQTHNAAKLNNAKRRWVKSGQCNPPVSICLRRPCQGSPGWQEKAATG